MPFFGQVWVWSLAGFLVGALLCWVLIALPARRRVAELEGRLAAARRARPEPAAPDSAAELLPGFGDQGARVAEIPPPPVAAPGALGDFTADRGREDVVDHPAPIDFSEHAATEHTVIDHRPAEHTVIDHRVIDRTAVERHDDDRSADGAGHGDDDHGDDHRDASHLEATQLDIASHFDLDHRDLVDHQDVHQDDDHQDDHRDQAPHHGADDAERTRYEDHLAAERGALVQPDQVEHETELARAVETTQYIPATRVEPGTVPEPAEDRWHGDAEDHRGERRDPHFVDDLADDRHPGAASRDDDRDDRDDRDDERDEDEAPRGGTIFTQHTTPIPAELIRRIDAQGRPDESLVDDLAEDPDEDQDEERPADHFPANSGAFTDPDDDRDEPEDPQGGSSDPAGSRFPAGATAFGDSRLPTRGGAAEESRSPARAASAGDTRFPAGAAAFERTRSEGSRFPVGEASVPALASVDLSTQFMPPPAPPAEPLPRRGADLPRRGAEPGRDRQPAAHAGTLPQASAAPVVEQAEPTQATLPKRVPKKPGDRFPFGVRTTSPASPQAQATARQGAQVPAAVPAGATAAEAGERSRSLFEPVLPADQAKQQTTPPRPRRSRSSQQVAPAGVDPFVPPGPFGPGSAMPLPGGASPSAEYTVKASVTALRYCAPDSPKFDRTVAEVWFRSVADAERVGFRPLA